MARNHGLRKDCAEANVRLSQRALQATAASFMERRFTRRRQHEARVKSNRVVDCATKLSPLVAKALQALDEPEPIDKSALNTQWDAEQVLKMLELDKTSDGDDGDKKAPVVRRTRLQSVVMKMRADEKKEAEAAQRASMRNAGGRMSRRLSFGGSFASREDARQSMAAFRRSSNASSAGGPPLPSSRRSSVSTPRGTMNSLEQNLHEMLENSTTRRTSFRENANDPAPPPDKSRAPMFRRASRVSRSGDAAFDDPLRTAASGRRLASGGAN